jgi:2-isopropylmalate synthase
MPDSGNHPAPLLARQSPSGMPVHRYGPFRAPYRVDLADRRWPSRELATAPQWCSVDLRDGNQALVDPMSPERKQRMFDLLVRLGFKQIEVGFPSAARAEFDFVRRLVEADLVPPDVTIQVMTPCREHLIDRTLESLRGVRRAIVHFYNSTSTVQRRTVFGLDRDAVKEIATQGARLCQKYAQIHAPDSDILFQYSPESYTGTELDYALEVCSAVIQVIDPEPDRPLVVNLPATVETATPNVYADSVEWMHRNLPRREALVLSLHPHNDRGTAVAAAELGLMAGADRVEGCLFGNGERTGNVDLVTLGLNLFAHGVDPQVDFSDIDEVRRTAEDCTRVPVHPRHPYAGDLVYTSFSGSHQDAIKKGLDALDRAARERAVPQREHRWEVPYLPIDPHDVGRSYEAVIRVNAQSGKSGIAYVLSAEHQVDLPRRFQVELAAVVQAHLDEMFGEIDPAGLWDIFRTEFLADHQRDRLVVLTGCALSGPGRAATAEALVGPAGEERPMRGTGDEPVEALVAALRAAGVAVTVLASAGHPLQGSDGPAAIAYVEADVQGRSRWGAGIGANGPVAAAAALAAAANRALRPAGGPG